MQVLILALEALKLFGNLLYALLFLGTVPVHHHCQEVANYQDQEEEAKVCPAIGLYLVGVIQ
jgi:hypothetical protein